MLKFTYAKLVRDEIVEHMVVSGAKPRYRILDEQEHKTELVSKIAEEAVEIITSDANDVAAEIADVQQALDDLKERYGLSDADIAKAQADKRDKKGAFKKGYYIDYVEIDEHDEWVGYYRKNPDLYPEIK